MCRSSEINGTAVDSIVLDVHKRTITHSYLGGYTKTWRFSTTSDKIVNELKQYGYIPVVLEANTTGKAVVFLLVCEVREMHMVVPSKVAMIVKAEIKTETRDDETLAKLYRSSFLPECCLPSPDTEMLRLVVQDSRTSADGYLSQAGACDESDTYAHFEEPAGQ